MVDEGNNVEEPEVISEPNKSQETPAVPEPPKQDPEIASLKAELEEMKQQQLKSNEMTEEKARKFDEVSKAITGKEEGFNKEKFFQDLADDPEGTLDKFVSGKTKTIQEELNKQKLSEADNRAFANLKTRYPDFNEVMTEAGKYLTKDDIEATENMANRTEIRFSLAKSRRDAMLTNRKTEETSALNEAKKKANQTSVTETPSTGASMPTGQSEAMERLNRSKADFDYVKTAEILENDLWHLSGQGRQ